MLNQIINSFLNISIIISHAFIKHNFYKNHDKNEILESNFLILNNYSKNIHFKYGLALSPRQNNSQNHSLSVEDMKKMPLHTFNTDQVKAIVFNQIESSKENFIQKLIKKWYEDIIIYNRSSNILISNASKEELLNASEKNQRKINKNRFKRSLLVERIHFTLPQKNQKSLQAFHVGWNKLPFPTSPFRAILKILKSENRRDPAFPTENQKQLQKNLENFPIFSIENNLKQMILSYPSEAFVKNWEDRLYDWYYRMFEWEKDTRGTNIGFFFFHPEDAKLYEHNIREFGALSAHDLGTHISTFRLSTAYHLSRTSPPETRFMFIPDIEEIGNLVTKYRFQYGKKMKFHQNQKITNSGFANQPVYIIQDVKIRKNIFDSEIIKYQGKLINHDYLFCSLEGAEVAWNNFRKELGNSRLPKKPNLLVYNFNSYIQDYENNNVGNKNFILIPNRKTYEIISTLQEVEQNKNKLQNFYDKFISSQIFFIQLWAKRFRLVLFHAPRVNEYPRRDLLLPNNNNQKK